MNMRVAVVGSTGQLGTDLVQILKDREYQVFPLSHDDIECIDLSSVQSALQTIRPDAVVNCASFVRVDDCEDRVQEAFQVNAIGAANVAKACSDLDALCVYVSTDYVFSGRKGEAYTESDSPDPINVYGISKLAGELLVMEACPRSLIVRVASLFGKAGARGKGGNFVETILGMAREGKPLRVVSDSLMSPTYTSDAAQAVERLLEQGATGVVHATNAGACSWHAFASKAVELVGLDVTVTGIPSEEFVTKARRPMNSALESTRLQGQAQNAMRPWPEALEAYLLEKKHLRG